MTVSVDTIRQTLDRVSDSWCAASRADADADAAAGASTREPMRPSILPKNYLVEFIAGTFGPASSGRGLTDHLESAQSVRRVANRTNLGVMAAQDLEENSRRKLEEVNLTRAVKFKHAIAQLAEYVTLSARRERDRPHVIREAFSLDDSPTAQHIASKMAESRFLERLAEAGSEIPEGRHARLCQAAVGNRFVETEAHFRTELASFIPDHEVDAEGARQPMTDDKVLKIINRLFDTFAPRMFLIGHSQGGLVALRAMQLGMRQVRVKDKRRFLYSPRSGRVHRYSPVALAIGLGAPFDGVDKTPAELGGGVDTPLDQASVPGLVRLMMPGVSQMIHGSSFLKTLRGAFIPFDCSAISIANPKDGLVSLAGTRLPVGDFVNMHNLTVTSTGAFDVAEMAPRAFRPMMYLWPALAVRHLLNEDERFEGLRQHCSFLFDLGENWDVDKGEIVRQIFQEENGQSVFDEMMFQVNFDGMREQLMANLLYRLRASDPEDRQRLGWMAPRLRSMIDDEALPFVNSIDKRAALALNYIDPP